jgi:cytochrome P450
MQATDEKGQHMTDEELWEDIHDVMGAGHETTATTIAAVMMRV